MSEGNQPTEKDLRFIREVVRPSIDSMETDCEIWDLPDGGYIKVWSDRKAAINKTTKGAPR
jgi:hypothetical protein